MVKLVRTVRGLLAILVAFVSLCCAADTEAATVVKVGIVKTRSSDTVSENSLRIYTLNYLNEIAKQTHWQFEYYFGTYADCRQKLANGELQLISSAVPANIGSNSTDILLSGYTCYNLLTLWTTTGSDIDFDNPSSLTGKRIALVDDDSIKEPFLHYVAANDWKVNLVPVPDAAAAVAAFNGGAVDAVVDDGTGELIDSRPVVPFATIEANFLTTAAHADIAEQMNMAITSIETRNPFFETWLEQEFLDPAIQHIVRFSATEREYIKNSPSLCAAFLPGCLPLFNTGDAFTDAGGVYVGYLHTMSEIAGLDVQAKQFPSTGQIEDALKNGTVDMTFAVYNRYLGGNVFFSNDIRKENFSAIKRRRGDADNKTIAVPMLFVGIKDFFVARYPDRIVRQYNTVDDCLNAVENGKCSMAYVPTMYLMYENALILRPNLETRDEESLHVPICLAVSAKSPDGLLNVMNTAALLMTNDQKRSIMFKNARPPFSFSYVLSQYPLPAAMVLSFVILGGAATIFILFRSKMQEKQNLVLSIKNAELQAALDTAESMRRDRDIYKSESETDRLTGLINKVAMEKLCRYRIEKFPDGIVGALYIIDLDHFKEANDTYGHQHGDEILRTFARSLRGIFRSTDAVARFGGDEFVVLIAAIPDPGIIDRQARHILQIARSVTIGGKNAAITASVGIALSPKNGNNYDELFRIADRALYNVKENGRDGYCIYQQEIVR